jgi:hypothetical protein
MTKIEGTWELGLGQCLPSGIALTTEGGFGLASVEATPPGAPFGLHGTDGREYSVGRWHWSARTWDRGITRARMQGDGNLVLYAGNTPVWSTGTHLNPGACLMVGEETSSLAVVGRDGVVLWRSWDYPDVNPRPTVRPRDPRETWELLGVNAHLRHQDNDGGRVLAMMRYLGVERVRSQLPWDGSRGEVINRIGRVANPVRFCAILAGHRDLQLAMAVARGGVYCVAFDAFEQLNELNNFHFETEDDSFQWEPGWPNNNGPAALDHCRRLYNCLKNDPLTSNIEVYGPTEGGSVLHNTPEFGRLSGLADVANVHVYLEPGMAFESRALHLLSRDYPTEMNQDVPVLEWVCTELGIRGYEPESREYAVRLLWALLDSMRLGIATYLYSMTDSPADVGQRYGLFNADGTPRLAAEMLHRLHAILHPPDNVPQDSPSRLDYSLGFEDGVRPDGFGDLAFRIDEARYAIVLWSPVPAEVELQLLSLSQEVRMFSLSDETSVSIPRNKIIGFGEHAEPAVLLVTV